MPSAIRIEQVLDCPSLPTLPTIAVEILRMTQDPEVSMDDIAELVKGDQGLASRILRTVNSSYYGLAKPCPTIERALGYLGMSAVKSLVLGFSLVKTSRSFDTDAQFDSTAHWRRSICGAAAARQIAQQAGACDPDEAFTAALFQDMGALAMVTALGERYGSATEKAEGDHGALPALESGAFGFDHAEVGGALAEKWQLPDSITQPVRYHHDPTGSPEESVTLVRTVALGRIAADTLAGAGEAALLGDLSAKAKEWFGIEDIGELLEHVSGAAGELAKLLEQDVGQLPDVQQILLQANERLVEHQLVVQRESVQLREQTLSDALTKIGNRKRFDATMDDEFAQAQAGNGPIGVLFMDGDKFKSINDNYGHSAGDAVLVEIASRLKNALGDDGLVCRYGGEEFSVILPGADKTRTLEIAERLRACMEASTFDLSHVEGAPAALPVTISIGACATDDATTWSSQDLMIQTADKAVYAAKGAGRNCVRLLEDPDDGPVPAGSTVRVLVIEDDPLAARLFEMMFGGERGVEVTVATTGVEGVRHLQQAEKGECEQPDLILCDSMLPDVPGEKIIRAVAKSPALAGIRTVVVCTSEEEQAKLVAAGATQASTRAAAARDIGTWSASLIMQCAEAKEAA